MLRHVDSNKHLKTLVVKGKGHSSTSYAASSCTVLIFEAQCLRRMILANTRDGLTDLNWIEEEDRRIQVEILSLIVHDKVRDVALEQNP